mmetsp:Transcript_26884/g.48654  ORF Transcript_26884/g.48654 Transcript_26884/m.48654 type:complete len:376 (+) Transcript_26884:1851-2978(+)
MRRQHHEPDHLARHPLIQQIPHGKEIAQGLGHLLALDLQHLVVHPHIGKAMTRAFRLGDLVLMVGKLQVVAAPMNVKPIPQQLIGHGRAFNMPTRPAPAPRRIPTGQLIGRRFPKDKVHRVLFIRRHLDPRTRDHVIDRAAGQRTVFRIFTHPKQHMPLVLVSIAIRDQPGNHRHHLRDILRRARLVIGPHRPQRVHIRMIPGDGLIGALGDQVFKASRSAGLLTLQRGGVDLVIHIGEIADIGHVIVTIGMAQQTVQHIKHQHGPRVAQMRPIVNCGATQIHPHIVRVDRHKRFFAAVKAVVEGNRHIMARASGWRGPNNSDLSWKQRTGPRERTQQIMQQRVQMVRVMGTGLARAGQSGQALFLCGPDVMLVA